MTQIPLLKKFFTIVEVMARWGWSIYDLQYAAESGELKVYVRPTAIEAAISPLLSFANKNKLKRCVLPATEIYHLFCAGGEPVAIQLHGHEIKIRFNDMVIMTADIEKYEQKNIQTDFVLFTPDYRQFRIHGELIHFGDKQARIAKHLHARLHSDNPWVNGKELMKVAGSGQYKIQNLFGGHKNWRTAIDSDGRGYYRFNL